MRDVIDSTNQEALRVRLRSGLIVDEATGCWLWQGTRDRKGYGFISVRAIGRKGSQPIRVHRASYRLFVGPIPDGHFVCHRCDNTGCLNPEHLFTGTAADNNRDMHAKGRGTKPPTARGSDCSTARLNPDLVRSIRARWAAGERICDLARSLGVSVSCVRGAATGRRWAHVR